MLSKLDESTHPWPLIQALSEHPVPLSFASQANGLDQLMNGVDTRLIVRAALAGLPVASAAQGHKAPTATTAAPMKDLIAAAGVLR